MFKTILFAVLCLLCIPLQASSQTQHSKPTRNRSISLRNVGRYANRYTPDTLTVSNVVLEDVRKLLDTWPEYLLQLYDPRADIRIGVKDEDGSSFDPHNFLICADDLGKLLLERKENWLNHKVNVHLRITDLGLTTNIYVGYVVKIELLNEKGKVVDKISKE